MLRSADGSLGIFEPSLSLKVDAANAEKLEVPASPFDGAGGRPIAWSDVRDLLQEQSRRLNAPVHLARIHREMRAAIAMQAGSRVDLSLLVARAVSQPLIEIVIDADAPASQRALLAHQEVRLRRQLDAVRGEAPRFRAILDYWIELRAGRAIAREMRRRRRGKAPPREDFAEALLEMSARLGPTRINYLVMTLLAAVSTAPGAVAACILIEMLRRTEWRGRIRAEFEALDASRLYSDPAPRLPDTVRFIKEAMRLWPFPLVTRRVAKQDIEIGDVRVAAGDTYDLSAYAMHRLPEFWDRPEQFDPDRWKEPRSRSARGCYVPYGFGPRTCVGAAIGQSQLILFCELAACAFDFEICAGHEPEIGTNVLAIPRDFVGIVRPRPAVPSASAG
ncbi:MAG: hypothetical protein QOI38_624 [Sphingomonadales bacterium]|nr:hypothetical protein [Sphingomonadales bacterium]